MPVKSYTEIVITVTAPVGTAEAAGLYDIAARAEADLRTKVRTKVKAKTADVRGRHNIRFWKQDD